MHGRVVVPASLLLTSLATVVLALGFLCVPYCTPCRGSRQRLEAVALLLLASLPAASLSAAPPSPIPASQPSPPPSPPLSSSREYGIFVTAGDFPSEVSWALSCDNGQQRLSGGALFRGSISVRPGMTCVLWMFDFYGDGWDGATWSGLGQQGLTLSAGYRGSVSFVAPYAPPPPPPLQPPLPPLQPPLPPSPPLPPLTPGFIFVADVESLRQQMADERDQVLRLLLRAGSHLRRPHQKMRAPGPCSSISVPGKGPLSKQKSTDRYLYFYPSLFPVGEGGA